MTTLVSPTLFERLMQAWTDLHVCEEELTDAILRILGVDPDDLEAWPFDDTSWDWHDMSVELYGVKPGFRLTAEQWEQFFVSGFHLLYVNYTDGTERTYHQHRDPVEGEIRVKHKAQKGGPSEVTS